MEMALKFVGGLYFAGIYLLILAFSAYFFLKKRRLFPFTALSIFISEMLFVLICSDVVLFRIFLYDEAFFGYLLAYGPIALFLMTLLTYFIGKMVDKARIDHKKRVCGLIFLGFIIIEVVIFVFGVNNFILRSDCVKKGSSWNFSDRKCE